MILVVGYGNPLRGDDRLGLYVVERLEEHNIPDLQTRCYQQLQLELLEEILNFQKVILVDAGNGPEDLLIQKIEPAAGKHLVSSHHLNPHVLSELAKVLYKKELNLYLCSIRGECFELGETLSAPALKNADQALTKILMLLKEK